MGCEVVLESCVVVVEEEETAGVFGGCFGRSGCLVIERCSSAREIGRDYDGCAGQGGCSMYGYIKYFMALPLVPSPGTCDTAWPV